MLGTKKAAAALALTVPMFSACHSTGKLSIRTEQQAPAAATPAEYGAAQIAQGRQALDHGQLSSAIAAFRNAKQVPDHAAGSSNGLAIAYSRLGRPDLAERYFRQAIALAPGERRYQANLLRFYKANPVEMPQMASVATAAKPLPPTTPAMGVRIVSRDGARSGLTISRPTSRLVRLSANEVRLGTGEPAATPVQAPARTASVSVTGRSVQANAPYPVRLTIAPREVLVGRAPAPAAVANKPQPAARPDYPVRVELTASR